MYFENFDDPIEKAKKQVEKEGFATYINSEYCKNFIETHKNCEKCEYSFACDKILEQTIKNEICDLRNAFLEDEQILLEDQDMMSIFNKAKEICKPNFNTSVCSKHCDMCQYLKHCNLFFSMILGFLLKKFNK